MRWTDPPTRREVTLLLFGVATFVLAFNLDNSLRFVGVDPVTTEGTVLSKFGYSSTYDAIGSDGRKPSMIKDPLEKQIWGEWGWEENRISGDGSERSQPKGVGKYGAMWKHMEVEDVMSTGRTANEPLERWWTPPDAQIGRHVTGFTVVDNLVLFNGTAYFVTDDSTFPSIQSLTSKFNHELGKWAIISSTEAARLMPRFGGRIDGVSWISTDTTPPPSTLMSMWRAYASLDAAIDSEGRTTLPAPHRLFFPYIRTFADPKPDRPDDYRGRIRSATGFPHLQQKLSFPTLNVLYKEDWDDFHLMQVPFLVERVVLVDYAAAQSVLEGTQPPFTALFANYASPHWWEPVRQTLEAAIGTEEINKRKRRPVVTYLARQHQRSGLKLRDEDHKKLIDALAKLGKSHGFELYIVSPSNPWWYKAEAITRSTVTLGVHGPELLDAVYMKPKGTLMEFFPSGSFSKSNEILARSVGLRYSAWWNEKQLEDQLPTVSEPTDQEVSIDAQAVARAVKQALSRR